MAGYDWAEGKSNNAVDAEGNGLFPASKIAKKLKVPTDFISSYAPHDGEYHHTSKFYNETNYYDLEIVREWLNDEKDEDGELIHDTSGKEALTKYREEKKNRKTEVYENCRVEWLEWYRGRGGRWHPKWECCEKSREGCTVIDKGGCMMEIIFPDGSKMRKKMGCKGFSVYDKDGEVIIGIDPDWCEGS